MGAALGEGVVVGAGVAGRRMDMQEARDERLENTLALPPPRRRKRTHRRPMITAIAGENLELARVARLPVVLAGHLHHRLSRFGPARKQLHRPEVRSARVGEGKQLPRERQGDGVGSREGWGESESMQLLRHCPDHSAVAMAYRVDEDTGEAIEVLCPGVISDVEVLAFHDHKGVFGECRHLPKVEDLPRQEFGCDEIVVGTCHRSLRSRVGGRR